MRYFEGGRRSGKTTKLVEFAKENDATIITHNRLNAELIKEFFDYDKVITIDYLYYERGKVEKYKEKYCVDNKHLFNLIHLDYLYAFNIIAETHLWDDFWYENY